MINADSLQTHWKPKKNDKADGEQQNISTQ